MAYQIVEVRDQFSAKGHLINSQKTVMGEFADPLAMYRELRTRNPEFKAFTEFGFRYSIRLETHRDWTRVDFGDIFRAVEGDEAYQAVLEERAPAQNEFDWVNAKLGA